MGNTTVHQTLRFLSEQASKLPRSRREAFYRETARAPEAVIVERLQVLLRDGADAILQGTLEQLPASKLSLIFSENRKHGFLTDGAVDRLVGQLSLAYGADCRLTEPKRLATLLSRLIERGEVELLSSILDSARLPDGTIDLLGDLHLRWLWCRHRQLLRGVVSGPALARRLLTAAHQSGDRRLISSLGPLMERLSSTQVWDLVCHFVQLHPAADRERALSTILGLLEARRMAQVISERYSDPEITVYWPLFPEQVRQELVQLGRARVRVWGEGQSKRRRGRSSSGQRRRTRDRTRARGHQPEVARALTTMVERFGFEESMSFQEAQRRYWRLVMKWHPDRAGSNPISERSIRDLNQAWDMAKVCFVKHAA